MKKLKVILTAGLLISLAFILPSNVSGQLPGFTPVDTGGIYNPGQSLVHVSGIVFDADNDGDLDPVINNIGTPTVYKPPLTLYKNERNGLYAQRVLFEEYKKAFEVKITSPIGDIDNDGDIDIVGHNYETDKGIFLNDGYGNYTSDTTIRLPYAISSLYPVLFDYNKDGYLDLIQFDSCATILYNNGNGKFLEKEVILFDEGIPGDVWIHGMSWGDADNDGDMDVFVGISQGIVNKNAFFIRKDSTMEQIKGDHITLGDSSATPCVNWIDYDNDGDMDLFVDNFTFDTINGPHWSLYKNLGNLEFEKHIFDDRNFRGAHANSSVWGDIDNDGDLDLFLSVENNPFPFAGPNYGHISTYPYNVLYLNNGDGEFTNIFDHTLTLTDSHTAKLFDHDNDGDLDVLMVRYSWKTGGHNQLYINEGNNNSSILINCVDKYSCATPFGTRIYAKTTINGKFVSQTREITPVNGHLSYANTRVHFGLGDAEFVDSLIIRWPSGHIDIYPDVPVNQFYHAIEDSVLEIDFKATNYIQLSPYFDTVVFSELGESKSIDLKGHYKLITGDTIPVFTGDTLEFTLYGNDNKDVVDATLDGSVLTLNEGFLLGNSVIKVIASAGFTRRMDQFTVLNNVLENLPKLTLANDTVSQGDNILATSNKDGTIYLVIVGTTPENIFIQTGRIKIIDSIQVTANKQVEFLTNNISPKDYLIYAKDIYGQFSDASAVVVDESTGIVQNATKYINIFPNPSNDILHIKVPAQFQNEFEVKMFTITGKMIFHKAVYIKQIDISSIPPGVYLISVKSKDFVSVKKIIKQ